MVSKAIDQEFNDADTWQLSGFEDTVSPSKTVPAIAIALTTLIPLRNKF